MPSVWIRDELGQRVRQIRKGAGLTQADLAEKLRGYDVDVHQSTVAKMEAGVRPTVAHEVWALASALGVDYYDLLPPPEGAAWTPLPASDEQRRAHLRNRALEEALFASRARLDADQRALANLEQEVKDSRREVDALREQSIPEDMKMDWANGEAGARDMLEREGRARRGQHQEEG